MTAAIKDLTPRLSTRKAAPGPTVGAGFAKGLFDFAVSKGASRELLIERSGIALNDVEDPDNRVPLPQYVALMRAGAELCNEPALALQFGETIDVAELSVVGLICYAADTPADAFVQMNRYARLIIDVELGESRDRFQLVQRDGDTWVVDTRRDPNSFPELTEASFARMVGRARQFADADTPYVKAVHVTHAEPSYRAEYDRIFRAPIVFDSDRNAMLIDGAWTSYKVVRPSRYAFRILSEHADALLESLESSKTTRGQVESLLIPVLHKGESKVETIARQMGLSRQTLYRRLKAEGVSFEKLLDELRHTMALHYLNGKKVSVGDAAYLVGFSDQSAFSRAFKRWTGSSPRKRVE
jgi:AraC-like DNA-binding protein